MKLKILVWLLALCFAMLLFVDRIRNFLMGPVRSWLYRIRNRLEVSILRAKGSKCGAQCWCKHCIKKRAFESYGSKPNVKQLGLSHHNPGKS